MNGINLAEGGHRIQSITEKKNTLKECLLLIHVLELRYTSLLGQFH